MSGSELLLQGEVDAGACFGIWSRTVATYQLFAGEVQQGLCHGWILELVAESSADHLLGWRALNDVLGLQAGAVAGACLEGVSRFFVEVAQQADAGYGLGWDTMKREAKDGIFLTHANQQLIGARNNLGQLQELQNQITNPDGLYAQRLDPDKRNQLLNSVTGRIFQVQEHNARQAEIREQRALRILDQMDRQAATGIPPSVAEQQRWQAALSGTSVAGEYAARVDQMNEVQTVLRLPLAEQQTYIQQARQRLTANGGSVGQIANVDRLERAVESNMQQMRDQPLEWNAMRTGAEIEPLNLSGIATPEGQEALAGQIASRFDTISAMRNQVGPEVSRNPFLPQEASLLKAALAQADDSTKLQVLGAIAQAAPNANDFAGALKAVAADDQSLMLAGMAQGRQLKAPDGTEVAPMILAGNKVLKDKSSPMPTEAKLRAVFDESVGQAIPSGSTQREQAFSAYKALYAGMAGPSGVTHDGTSAEVDDGLAAKALEMATGGISETKTGWFSREKVVRPYGMSDDAFQDALGSQLDALSEHSGIAKGSLETMPLMPVQGAEGAYYLLNGGRAQIDPKTNEPMIVRVK
ncbi:hypothetical protein N5D41_11555 [Pseudomonas toyotomiensis]|uniref:Uncharacterized protein n=1 Tax=Ectopseudomonas toyotomiensis TaxID=554344 RepID=A0AA42LHH5_9GAMM|nr:hypothetical protein [Pseudomonas toyotomiensis]MDH0702122.1 hypothetical protein [Pseudomonas toyotomiensis]